MWKQFISAYLNFSKRERRSIFVLISFIIVFLLLPFTYPFFIKETKYDHNILQGKIADLQIKTDSSEQFSQEKKDIDNYQLNTFPTENHVDLAHKSLFYFDPNTLPDDGWKQLGLPDKTILTIKKYIAKGGKFYKAEDIYKIWGLNRELATQLIPYIKFEDKHENNSNEYTKNLYASNKNTTSAKKTVDFIDVNTADTSDFISLPGIGSKLSQRIINFRDKLGGFYKIDQVGETFGLPDSTFQKIKPRLILNPRNTVKQFNINTATIDEMKTHPYLKYAVANAIVQYRNQHGNYNSVEDIKKIMTIDTELYNKIVPYLKVN